ncbi:MAG: hypothetical protein RSB57_10770 [Hungatella sp.]
MMDMLSVTNNTATMHTAKTAAAVKKAAAAVIETEKTIQNVDTFVKSEDTAKIEDYEPKKSLTAEEMKEIQEQQMASFSNMLSGMLKTQGQKNDFAKNGITQDLFKQLSPTASDRVKATQAISEDGEWGVKAVAGRIMDMAVALSGGDPSKIALLKDAVEKGFEAAGAAWGGKMPSITDQTHEEIGKRFEYWEKNGSLDGYSMGDEK